MIESGTRKFVPALGYGWLTPMFDVVLRWTTREESFRKRLMAQADLSGAQHVLDLGCGTGSLAVRMKQDFPHVNFVGLDADGEMLCRARAKATAAHTAIQFDRGFSRELPYDDATFDRVVSTLFFHHLDGQEKVRTLKEALRVLRPGGQLHIADWGRPTGPMMRMMFLVVRITDGFEVTRDNVNGSMPTMLQDAGFEAVRENGAMNMLCGTVRFIAAVKPHPAAG